MIVQLRAVEAQWRARVEEEQAAARRQLSDVSQQHTQELSSLQHEVSSLMQQLNESILDKSRVVDRITAEDEQRTQETLAAFAEWKRRELLHLESQYVICLPPSA